MTTEPSSMTEPLQTVKKVTYAAMEQTKVISTEPKSTDQLFTAEPNFWKSGLCECNECGVCLLSIFCPVCYASALSVRLKEMILVPCFPGGIATMRTKMRLNNDIEGNLLEDTCCSCVFPPCVIAQLGKQMNLDQEKYPKVLGDLC